MHGERGAVCLDVVVMMEGSRKTGEGGGPDAITQQGAEEQAAQSGPWIKRVEGVEGCRDADWMSHGPQCVQTHRRFGHRLWATALIAPIPSVAFW